MMEVIQVLKILFLIHDLGQGGAEKVLVNLVNHMDRTKFDITVIALFGGGVNEQFLKHDIKFYAAFHQAVPGNSKLMKLFTPRQLHQWIIKDKYDIEVSYLEGPSARIISGCPNKETKLISWIHVEQHTKEIASQAFRSYGESVECYGRFHKIVCVSQSVKEDFESLYPMLPEADVLYNTNETDAWESDALRGAASESIQCNYDLVGFKTSNANWNLTRKQTPPISGGGYIVGTIFFRNCTRYSIFRECCTQSNFCRNTRLGLRKG